MGLSAPEVVSTAQASSSAGLPVASPPYKRSAAQLKSSPERVPDPVLGNGEPSAGVNAPVAELIRNIETLVSFETARSCPLGEITMLALGEQQFVVVPRSESAPPGAMANVWIWPLLDAIRNFPSGVGASEMPWQLSSVRPLGNGEPATGLSTPLVGLIWKTLIVRSPVLATNRRLSIWLR